MATRLMDAMVERGHSVSLISWDLDGASGFYPMRSEIAWHCLNTGDPRRRASLHEMFRRAAVVRQLVRECRPDAIIAFQSGPFIALRAYTIGLGVPIVASERNAPTIFDHTRAGRWRSVVFQGLRLANQITIQCESYRSLYPGYLRDRITTIPNPVFPAQRQAQPATPVAGRFRLLSVGRLGYQKNYSVLIDAFATIANNLPDWDLIIYGEGEERAALERRIAELGLAERISLPGITTDIESVYVKAHAIVLSSRWEGFPNVLAEGMAHGLPAVGFEETAGVKDLVEHEITGLLARGNDNADFLAKALCDLMVDHERRARMGVQAAERVRQYAPRKIFDAWEKLLLDISGRT